MKSLAMSNEIDANTSNAIEYDSNYEREKRQIS
eukprot:CAMPEP_0196820938 /NCGR_PEP_ID=MMETSP1362-20130617/77168_1 /TAXON_ID=163516 /ORGANISM="Leptocylindrus danicus, Strain CCMP1856" /LENGTH=32 /DNA_ID= /DNA_START= /DNA_END= /DNA_ORIENTATION=